MFHRISFSALALATVATPSFAQEAPAAEGNTPEPPVIAQQQEESPPEPVYERNQIVVSAGRLPGQVVTDAPPILELNAEEIAAYGASSVQDLLTALAPQTGSGRGRGGGMPVMLINGVRAGSFRELQDIPPEAIAKVEVLPEEVALQFGYRADQRVVNFVLKPNFRALRMEARGSVPQDGGFAEHSEEVTLTRIAEKNRLNITLAISDVSPLSEAERDILQPAPPANVATLASDPADDAAYRSLLGDSRKLSLNASLHRMLGKGRSLSLNGNVERNNSRNLFGLNQTVLALPAGGRLLRLVDEPRPLTRVSETDVFSASAAYNHPLGNWMLTVTGDGSLTRGTTETDNRADFSAVQAAVTAGTQDAGAAGFPQLLLSPSTNSRGRLTAVVGLATASGSAFRLPAGDAMMTLRAGWSQRSIDSSSDRTGAISTRLDRRAPTAGFNLDLPLTSRREGFGGVLGDLSINLNGGYSNLSDFGRLWEKGAGLNWGITEKLRLSASLAWQDSAPGLSDLGAAVIVTPGVTLYDFTRSETVVATITSGGNPDLAKERRRDMKASAFWQVPLGQQTMLIAEYFDNRSRNSSNGFPLLTSEIEAAFPGRVSRDSGGRLVAIDQRSVTFADRRSKLMRFGFNVGGTIGKPDPARAGAGRPGGGPGAGPGGRPGGGPGMGGGMGRPGGGPPGGGPRMGGGAGGGGRGGPPGMFGGGGANGQGRWNFSLLYSPRLTETVLIAPGVPQLDLLDGSAIGGDGGLSRHSFEAEGGVFYRGIGMRFSATHDSGSRVRGSGLPGSSDLEFGTLTRVNLRMFADFDQMPRLTSAVPFLKSSRIGLRVDNVFGTVRTVQDENGLVPLRFQSGLIDPRGRVFGLFIRKVF